MTALALNPGPLGLSDLVHSGAIVGAPRTGPKRFWTAREEMLLRQHYPIEGVAGCLPQLPGRSAGSIYQHANQLGLRSPAQGSAPRERQRWTSSEQIDAVIRREYPARTHKGAVEEIARIVGRPRWWVSRRVVDLGLAQVRRKEAPWSAAEDDLLATMAARKPSAIARMLLRQGHRRTATAVAVRLKRIGVATGRNADDSHYTAHALGGLMGVDIKTVTRWIDKGLLKAGRRGTDRVEAQGGDEWRIARGAVRRFVIDNVAVVDLRKVDKHWFVDMLAGGGAA